MSDNRESLRHRLRALTSKTVENGCTEAEALSAARLLGSLMTKYGFTFDDLADVEEIGPRDYVSPTGRLGNLQHVLVAIGKFCDCELQKMAADRLRFFGHESDVQVAIYLAHLCRSAMVSAWSAHRRELGRPARKGERASFEVGMVVRLGARIDEMRREREAATDGKRSGRDLAVVKAGLVRQFMAAQGIQPGRTRQSRRGGDAASYGAGRAAGDRVALNPGIPRAPAGYLSHG